MRAAYNLRSKPNINYNLLGLYKIIPFDFFPPLKYRYRLPAFAQHHFILDLFFVMQ